MDSNSGNEVDQNELGIEKSPNTPKRILIIWFVIISTVAIIVVFLGLVLIADISNHISSIEKTAITEADHEDYWFDEKYGVCWESDMGMECYDNPGEILTRINKLKRIRRILVTFGPIAILTSIIFLWKSLGKNRMFLPILISIMLIPYLIAIVFVFGYLVQTVS